MIKGKPYPNLGPAVAKFRRIKHPTWEQRQAHGEAVEEAVRALQRRELQRELPSFKPSCASGTWCNGGSEGDVGDAIRSRQRASLDRCAESERKRRTEEKWLKLYIEAMKARHGKDWNYEAD